MFAIDLLYLIEDDIFGVDELRVRLVACVLVIDHELVLPVICRLDAEEGIIVLVEFFQVGFAEPECYLNPMGEYERSLRVQTALRSED